MVVLLGNLPEVSVFTWPSLVATAGLEQLVHPLESEEMLGHRFFLEQ